MFDYILFDLDGTLTDPKEGITKSVQYALADFGIEEKNLDKLEVFIGPPLKESFIEFYNFNEQDALKAVDKYRERFVVTGIFENKIYEGIPELLKDLKTADYLLAVVSNKADYAVQILCEQYFPGMFDLAVGERENVRRKPAPDSVNAVLAEFELKKADAVYIGDSDVDIETAENVGTDSILVAWGFRGADFLREKGAKNIVFDTEELKRCLLE